MVARSSLFETAVPQAEQKRPLTAISFPHEEH
jgi:hypothetical protein